MKTDALTQEAGPGCRLLSRAAVAVLAVLSAPALAAINVNVTHVGFPAIGSSRFDSGNVIRRSAWVPIIVDIDLLDQPSFDGSARIAQFDIDGDRHLDSVEVHLREDTGGHQRVWLYTLVNPSRDDGRCYVELLNDDGEAIEIIAAGEPAYRAGPVDDKQPHQLTDDDFLIVSLSSSTMGHVKDLVESEDIGIFSRDIFVGHLAPTDMPELWYGLEAVDAIVWDDARPEQLTARQLDALVHWVRQGGMLFLTTAESAGSVKLAESLERILPVELGDIKPVPNLADVRNELLDPPATGDSGSARVPGRDTGENWYNTPFPSPVTVAQCTLRSDATRIAPLDKDEPLVVARRSEGRGQVTFAAVTVRDLLSGGGGAAALFTRLFWLNKQRETEEFGTNALSLFPEVVSAVAFTTSSSVYLLAASVFSVAYVVLATGGVWWFLGRRGWRRHSWSVFGIAAIAAAFLSVTGVRAFQGFGERVHQVSVVDLTAGDPSAFVATFFGMKTATDARLDVWLPQSPQRDTEPAQSTAFLRPLTSGRVLFEEHTSFTDPVTYRLAPSVSVVDDVRFRATLKRFEGRWDGAIDGIVTASLTARGRILTDDSYITNELGVDLTDCWLIHTSRPFDEFEEGVRNSWIYAFPLGDLKADGQRVLVAERCYTPEIDQSMTQFLSQRELGGAQVTWSRAFRSAISNIGLGATTPAAGTLADVQKALLLATTIGEFDPASLKGMTSHLAGTTQTWSRDRLRWMDLRQQFSPGTVILIGFAQDPGPVRLFRRSGDRRYRMIEPEPEYSWTMYRIRIPLTTKSGASDKHT